MIWILYSSSKFDIKIYKSVSYSLSNKKIIWYSLHNETSQTVKEVKHHKHWRKWNIINIEGSETSVIAIQVRDTWLHMISWTKNIQNNFKNLCTNSYQVVLGNKYHHFFFIISWHFIQSILTHLLLDLFHYILTEILSTGLV